MYLLLEGNETPNANSGTNQNLSSSKLILPCPNRSILAYGEVTLVPKVFMECGVGGVVAGTLFMLNDSVNLSSRWYTCSMTLRMDKISLAERQSRFIDISGTIWLTVELSGM